MSLIIESGAIVDGAESFVSVAELDSYASKRGLSLPTESAEKEILLVKAMDYLLGREDDLQGQRVSIEQALPFPRDNVMVNGFSLASYDVPVQIKQAQMQLAVEATTNDLVVNTDGQEIIEQEVAGITKTRFSETGNTNKQPRFEKVERLLKPLTKGFDMRIVR